MKAYCTPQLLDSRFRGNDGEIDVTYFDRHSREGGNPGDIELTFRNRHSRELCMPWIPASRGWQSGNPGEIDLTLLQEHQ